MTGGERLVSRHVEAMGISAIKEMAIMSANAPGSVSLAWGLPSFRTPEPIRQAVVAALAEDPDAGKYTLPHGLPEFRECVARHHAATMGVTVDPERHVLVTAGNMQGMSTLLRTLLTPGDEVILTDPCFASHIQQVRFCGAQPVFWPLSREGNWRLQPQELPALITERTKALILVTPSNPTGAMFDREDLQEVAAVARENNVLVLQDDPYSELVYDETPFHLASLPAMREHLVYLFSFSKCHAMSGWRLGYMILPEWLREHVLKVHDADIICASRPAQIGGMAAITGNRSHIAEFRSVLAKRRDLMCQRLERLPSVFQYAVPQGAYYVFPEIVAPHQSSHEFAVRLLTEAGVAVTPGSAFGPSGEHHVRLAFCVEEDEINHAFDRVETWAKQR